jgi:5-methylcytosine-specific restriction protein A
MPTLRRRCPRCPNVQPCPVHAVLRPRWAAHDRVSSAARGYGSAWRRLRLFVLNEEPLCHYCRRRPSTEVDHVIPKCDGGTDDRANLAGTCTPCHDEKTRGEGNRQRWRA